MTKLAIEVEEAEQFPEIAARAFRTAVSGRPDADVEDVLASCSRLQNDR